MSSNNNTQSARVNAGCNTIENQLGKQHITKLFKNLQEAEAEELDIDSAAKEVADIDSARAFDFFCGAHIYIARPLNSTTLYSQGFLCCRCNITYGYIVSNLRNKLFT